MAGPWFTVQRTGDDWQVLDEIWLSNGHTNDRGRVELRVKLEEPSDEVELVPVDGSRSSSRNG